MRLLKQHIGVLSILFALWLSLTSAFYFGLFQTVEDKLTDHAMRLRKQPTIRQDLITLDIDDPAITTVGRWPWNWNIHRHVLDFLNRHEIRYVFVVDIDFSKPPLHTLTATERELIEAELGAKDKGRILSLLKQKDPLALVRQSALMKERLFFTASSKLEDDQIHRQPNHQVLNPTFKLRGVTIGGKVDFPTASTVLLPIKDLSDNSAGITVNSYIPDGDGVIRRYPLFIRHGDHLYPSTAIRAVMAILDTDRLEIEDRRVILHYRDGDLSIPTDRAGQVKVNWTGRYTASFVHVPFNLLTPFVVVQSLKDRLKTIDTNQLSDPMKIHSLLIEQAIDMGLLTKKDATNKATVVFLAFLLEHYFVNGGYGITETLTALGLDPSNQDILALANQVYLNNLAHKLYKSQQRIYSFDELLQQVNPKVKEVDLLKDSYEQLLQYLKDNKDPEALRPLYFEPSKTLVLEGKRIDINPSFFKGKTAFYGLTATGLSSQNPTPFMERHPMLDLPPQVTNTMLTGQFLRESPKVASMGLLFLYFFTVSVVALKTTPLRGLLVVVLLTAIHLSASWFFFIKHGLLIPVIPTVVALTSGYLCAVFFRYLKEYAERRRVRRMFSTMVSPEVLRILEARPDAVALKGEIRDASVFSSDVSGFTTISEGVTAQELARILNLYLTAMSNIIMSYGGYVDKYEGDAIKAVFGVPLTDEGHPYKVCWSALAQQEELKVIQRMILIRYGVKITARMGINTGMVYAGNMGSAKRLQYTVMGEAVHLAEELEPANKLFDTWIAAGDETVRRCDGYVRFRHLGSFETSDGMLINAHEVVSWDTERFINYWKDRPVPELLLEPYKKLNPLRVVALTDYLLGKLKTIDNGLLQEILRSLKSHYDKAIEYLKIESLSLYRSMVLTLRQIGNHYGYDEDWIMQRADSPEERLRLLDEGMQHLRLFITNNTSDLSDRQEALLMIEEVQKTLEAFRKRLALQADQDKTIATLRDFIGGLFLDPDRTLGFYDPERTEAIAYDIKKAGEELASIIRQGSGQYFHFLALSIGGSSEV